MRNKIRIFVKNKPCWLYEMTVKDIFEFNYVIKNISNIEAVEYLFKCFSDNSDEQFLLKSITTCPFEILLNLTVSEFQDFIKSFLKQNNQFFNKNKQKPNLVQGKENEFENNLFNVCCFLIENGHVNVMDYGYSFFLQAINNHEKIKCRNTAETAMAIRMAQHADDKQWKKYMRSLGVK